MFLEDVSRGDTVSALEEALIAARADPKKEKNGFSVKLTVLPCANITTFRRGPS